MTTYLHWQLVLAGDPYLDSQSELYSHTEPITQAMSKNGYRLLFASMMGSGSQCVHHNDLGLSAVNPWSKRKNSSKVVLEPHENHTKKKSYLGLLGVIFRCTMQPLNLEGTGDVSPWHVSCHHNLWSWAAQRVGKSLLTLGSAALCLRCSLLEKGYNHEMLSFVVLPVCYCAFSISSLGG